jgi:hypothetical protein
MPHGRSRSPRRKKKKKAEKKGQKRGRSRSPSRSRSRGRARARSHSRSRSRSRDRVALPGAGQGSKVVGMKIVYQMGQLGVMKEMNGVELFELDQVREFAQLDNLAREAIRTKLVSAGVFQLSPSASQLDVTYYFENQGFRAVTNKLNWGPLCQTAAIGVDAMNTGLHTKYVVATVKVTPSSSSFVLILYTCSSCILHFSQRCAA